MSQWDYGFLSGLLLGLQISLLLGLIWFGYYMKGKPRDNAEDKQ